MKKLIALLTLAGMLTFAGSYFIYANETDDENYRTVETV